MNAFHDAQFVRGGVTAFTFGFAAPQVLCDIALAQGVPSRNLVVLYLSGGNDALSTVIPYRDANYYTRRPTIAVPAGSVLQIGTRPRRRRARPASAAHRAEERSSTPAGSPSSSAPATRTRAARTSPAPTSGAPRIPATRRAPAGSVAISTRCRRRSIRWSRGTRSARRRVRCWRGRSACRRSPALPPTASPAPTAATEAVFERTAQARISSHLPVDRPHLAFVNATTQAALGTLDRVAHGGHVPSRRHLSEQRLRPGAAGGRRRDEQGDRHQGVLGPDRRLRHARRAGREPRARTST